MDKFDVICRTCNIERTNLVNLSSNAPEYADTLLLRDILFIVCPSLPLEMSERLPQHICYCCTKQLELAYKFQLQCTKSHEEQWRLIESTIDREESPVEECIQNYNQFYEANKSSVDDEFEDSSPVLTENLEFVFEEEIEESDDAPPEVDEIPEESSTIDLKTNTESEALNICSHCNKKFHTHKGLLLHEKLTHKNLKPIFLKAEVLTVECKYCSELFEKKSDLAMHCRRKHKKYFTSELNCHFCHKVFLDKNKFKHHLLYHDEKEFVCTVKDCNRIFMIKYKLTDHLRRFHGITLSSSEIKALKPSVNDESSSVQMPSE